MTPRDSKGAGRLEFTTAIAGWLLLAGSAADLIALKSGVLGHSPRWLALLFAGALVAFAARAGQVVRRLIRRREQRWRTAAELLRVLGVLVAIAAGSANWLLGLQGAVVLNERETVRLHETGDLQQFEAGPLARLEEMRFLVTLEELELNPVGESGFLPASRIRVGRDGEEPESLLVSPLRWAGAGPLRFHQGAFGFAPRIVILRSADDGEETVFDRVVPFTTERHGPSGLSFEGRFTIESDGLAVTGAVDLDSLDAGMRGHATLQLAVEQEGQLLGRGSLMPGRFAEVGRGYRVGFAGLERWSEIDVSRRNYAPILLGGAGVAVLGVLLWLVTFWRGR